MRVKQILSLLLVIAAIGCTEKTPQEEGLSYDTMKANFQNPPQTSSVDCWWWWLNSNVTKEAITKDLEAMKAKGFYGAMVFDAGGHMQGGHHDIPAGPEFGTKEWRDLFVFALDEAERLGLEIGFNIQSGWNLGGPCVTPQYAAKRITYSEIRVSGGKEGAIKLEQPATKNDYYKDIAVLAFPVDDSKVSDEPIHSLEYKLSIHELGGSAPDCRFLIDNKEIDPREKITGTPYIINKSDIIDLSAMTDADGNLNWNVPEGEWIIMRVGYTPTGAKVSTSSRNYQGLVLDYLSADAIHYYLSTVVDPIFEAAGHHVGTTLKFMETDSWECGGMNWSDNFASDFKALNGYDIISYLPVVGGYVVDDMDKTSAFLADFRKTVGWAVANNHYRNFGEYAHRHNMGIQPESAGPHAGPFDGVRNYSFSDIVMGEFWAQSPHRPTPATRFFMKQASSSAHIYGKKIVGAESFTTIGPHWNDRIWHDQKSAFDHEICAGLNRAYFHTFTCSPKEMGLPGQEYFAGTHVNPQVTWWAEADGFINYMKRVQSLVQEARFCGDVLYYYGDHIPVIYPFKHSNMAGTMPGFDFDVTSEDALLQFEVDADGSIIVPSGLKYRVLVLPDHKVLSLAVLEKVDQMLKKGATIIGYKPERCITLIGGQKAQDKFKALSDKIWGTASEKGEKKYGKGTLAWGVNARDFLLSKGLVEDFKVEEDPQLEKVDYIHLTFDGRQMYYIANITDAALDITPSFRVSGRAPELWDAMTGVIRPLEAFTQKSGTTTVPLHLDPCGAAIVIFNEEIAADACGTAEKNFADYTVLQDIRGPWKVAFNPEWGAPAQTEFKELIDWTASNDPGIKFYSGHATYTTTFDFEKEDGVDYFIDLGSVEDVGMATVKVNGIDKGLVWAKPFRVEVTDVVKSGANTLEVTVVNSWFNRVLGDQLNPDRKQYTSTNIVVVHDQYGKPRSVSDLSPSGLIGPVTIVKD